MISPPLLDQDLLPGRFFRRFEQPCVLRSSVARRVHPVPTQEQNPLFNIYATATGMYEIAHMAI